MLVSALQDIWLGGLFALLIGILLGVFYFTGLWWTVCQLGTNEQVALLFLGSALMRTVVVVAGFYFILADSWQKLLIGVLGFMLVRLWATRYVAR